VTQPGKRADNGWEFCPSCNGFESDDCATCDSGDLFEPVDFASATREQRGLFPVFDLQLAV
jgi:hypothetical protein